MHRLRTLFRPLFVVLAVGLSLAGAGASRADAAAKSFRLERLVTVATVAADGSMQVEESITYVFQGGPFNFGIRSFLPADRARIAGFTAQDDSGRALETIPPASSVSGEWEWRLGGVSDARVTYHLAYTVPRAVDLGTDVGELYWQFLGSDHPGVGRVSVEIRVPGDPPPATATTPASDISVLRGWGHGPRSGRVEVLQGRVLLDVSGVPAGRFVEARLAIPATAFTGDATSGARLPTILAEEGQAIDQTLAEDKGRGASKPEDDNTLENLLSPGAGVLGFLGLGALWMKWGREPKPDPMIGDYWREPLEDAPAVVLANRAKGTVPLGSAMGSTIIDLAQRGYLTIAETRHERLGKDDITHHFTWKGKPTADLAPYEKLLLEHLFFGRDTASTDTMTDWAKANPNLARAFGNNFKTQVGQAYAAKGYKSKRRGPASALLVLLALTVALVGFISNAMGGKLGLICYIAAGVIVVAGGVLLENRTRAGADEYAKSEALKRFLKDFSNLEEAPAGHLILWERFLVYAVTLGVSKELLDGLRVKLPAVVNDPNYGAWYIGMAGARRFDHFHEFDHSFAQRAATAIIPPSKSGGSGGFSSVGGGGGGGGGGFGAR